MPCDLLVFYLRDRVSDDMVAAHAAGAGSEVFKGLRLKSGEGLSGWVAVNTLTIMNSSGALDLADRRERLPLALESALATPLCAGDDVVGVLTLYSAVRNSFTTEHQQVVEFAARQIGPALERALSFEQERMASLFDAETGLPNEKYLERVLASAMYCRRADGLRPGLLTLQTANGGGGHAPAGLVLRLAATSRMAVRVTDLVFRTGEREFTILMADTTADAMATVARRVTEAMGEALGRWPGRRHRIGLRPLPGTCRRTRRPPPRGTDTAAAGASRVDHLAILRTQDLAIWLGLGRLPPFRPPPSR